MLAAALIAAAAHTAQAAPVGEIACRGDGTRIALLIGNQDYVGTMQPLDNPRRDIAALGALLCQHGFTVFRHANLDVTSFDSTVESFARRQRDEDGARLLLRARLCGGSTQLARAGRCTARLRRYFGRWQRRDSLAAAACRPG
jgi:hypothetical protein